MKISEVGKLQCSVAKTLSVIGDPWTLLILRTAFLKGRRFQDFEQSLGLSKAILSDRLNALVNAAIFRRERYQDSPPRYEYRLTLKGLELYPVFVGLAQWGDKWGWGADESPPITIAHAECGAVNALTLTCGGCGQPVKAQDMEVVAA
jgi:DNA-binding HxlR family transcriptional regulator